MRVCVNNTKKIYLQMSLCVANVNNQGSISRTSIHFRLTLTSVATLPEGGGDH